MGEIPKFDRSQADIVRAYYAGPHRGKDAWTYPKAAGFLFAVACEPELVHPREWMPVLLEEEGSAPAKAAPGEAVTGAFLSLHKWIERGVKHGKPTLPAGCEPVADGMANLDPASPLSQWSQGFLAGQEWTVAEDWLEVLPESMGDEIGAVLMALTFFSSRAIAEGYCKEMQTAKDPVPLEEVALVMSKLLPDAMGEYGSLALDVRKAMAEIPEEARSEEPEKPREPDSYCPCGSGKKYKACCGRRRSAPGVRRKA